MAPTILYHHRTRSRDGQSVHIDEIISALRKADANVVVVEPRRVAATESTFERKFFPASIYEVLEFGYNVVEFFQMAVKIVKHKPIAIYERENLFTLSGVWASQLFKLPLLLEVKRAVGSGASKIWIAFLEAHSTLDGTRVLAFRLRCSSRNSSSCQYRASIGDKAAY